MALSDGLVLVSLASYSLRSMAKQLLPEPPLKAEIESKNSRDHDFREALIERLQTTLAMASRGERRRIRSMIRWLTEGLRTSA